MRFVIVTGVSGAGKTAALKMLEDMGYFCVDNLPIQLLEKFASLLPEMQSENVRNVALGIDARSGSALDELEAHKKNGTKPMNARDLLRRLREEEA